MEVRVPSSVRWQAPVWLPLECFTEDEVFVGHTRWPVGIRLLDLLNSVYATRHDSGGDFLDFIDVSGEDDSVQTHLNKSAVAMVAIDDMNLARGVGGSGDRRYPFVQKSEVPVSVRTRSYSIDGHMHLAENETIQDILNRDALFLPITGTTIATSENRFYANRPFVAVNKRHIIRVQVGAPADGQARE